MTNEIQLLSDLGVPLLLRSKTKIVSPQTSEKSFFYVESGSLQQYYLIKGKRHVFRLIGENSFCESFTILNGNVNQFEFIETVSEVTLIKYDYDLTIERINNNLVLSNFFRSLLENFLLLQEERVIKLLSLKPIDRYTDFIKNDYQKIGQFTDATIASYLGMTKETLSRFRNKKLI